jgi:hypothetical protein
VFKYRPVGCIVVPQAVCTPKDGECTRRQRSGAERRPRRHSTRTGLALPPLGLHVTTLALGLQTSLPETFKRPKHPKRVFLAFDPPYHDPQEADLSDPASHARCRRLLPRHSNISSCFLDRRIRSCMSSPRRYWPSSDACCRTWVPVAGVHYSA